MIDFDKAIELFRHHDIVRFILTGLGESEYKTVEFKDVVDSLEKQIPRLVDMSHCNCGMALDNVWKYCPNCGQALKWGGATDGDTSTD